MAATKIDPLTVTAAKAQICAILQELQKTGIWVRAIDINWMTQVAGEDVESPKGSIQCSVKLQADL